MPTQTLRAVSPFIKIGVAAATGIDLNKASQVTREPGRTPRGEFGEKRPIPLAVPARLDELAGYATGQIPLASRLRDLAAGPQQRYGTGAPITRGGEKVPTGRTRLNSLAALIGVPLPEKLDVEAVKEQRQRRITGQR